MPKRSNQKQILSDERSAKKRINTRNSRNFTIPKNFFPVWVNWNGKQYMLWVHRMAIGCYRISTLAKIIIWACKISIWPNQLQFNQWHQRDPLVNGQSTKKIVLNFTKPHRWIHVYIVHTSYTHAKCELNFRSDGKRTRIQSESNQQTYAKICESLTKVRNE